MHLFSSLTEFSGVGLLLLLLLLLSGLGGAAAWGRQGLYGKRGC